MTGYIARRLLGIIPVMLLVSVIVFTLIRIIPGDVVDLMLENLASGGERGVEAKVREELRAQLGLDNPLPIQYFDYMRGVVQGDLGQSLFRGRPVSGEIVKAFPVTAQLTIVAIVIAFGISIPLGTLSAVNQDGWIDNVARTGAILGLSLPTFWTGTMLVVFMARWWSYTPPLEFISPVSSPWLNFQKIVFPAAVLAVVLAGSVARMMRSSLLEVLRQDYIRTARAKGLLTRVVVTRHAMKNAMIPVITIVGLQFAQLLGGTVIVETIFTIPGLGRLTVDAIMNRDYPVLQGTVLLFAATLLTMNLIIDVFYSWLDPRIRYGASD